MGENREKRIPPNKKIAIALIGITMICLSVFAYTFSDIWLSPEM